MTKQEAVRIVKRLDRIEQAILELDRAIRSLRESGGVGSLPSPPASPSAADEWQIERFRIQAAAHLTNKVSPPRRRRLAALAFWR